MVVDQGYLVSNAPTMNIRELSVHMPNAVSVAATAGRFLANSSCISLMSSFNYLKY